jgi:hypothetical protein
MVLSGYRELIILFTVATVTAFSSVVLMRAIAAPAPSGSCS